MLVNTKLRRLTQAGVTIPELLLVIGVSSMLILTFTTISVNLYGDTIRATTYSQLATESQLILRSVVEELRQSSSIKESNANLDINAPGGTWNTSNSSLILIISTPALDSSNNFIQDTATGFPYQNEIVYFASGGKLYKRIIANQSAPGNSKQTTCPLGVASATCPPDIEMSSNFRDMNFVFYDQNDATTASIPQARSIKLLIQMERRIFGKSVQFDNAIRITMRNTAS